MRSSLVQIVGHRRACFERQGHLCRIYQRMISERLQIAQRFRSEGEGESAHRRSA
jgi:membrane protease subunit HflC